MNKSHFFSDEIIFSSEVWYDYITYQPWKRNLVLRSIQWRRWNNSQRGINTNKEFVLLCRWQRICMIHYGRSLVRNLIALRVFCQCSRVMSIWAPSFKHMTENVSVYGQFIHCGRQPPRRNNSIIWTFYVATPQQQPKRNQEYQSTKKVIWLSTVVCLLSIPHEWIYLCHGAGKFSW